MSGLALQQAAYWYNQYHALAPDDLLGLKRLVGACTTLEQTAVEDENCLAAAERVAGMEIHSSRMDGGTRSKDR